MKIIATIAFCFAALCAMPAAAVTYSSEGVTAAEVAAVLKDRGLDAEISTDDWGDPLIKTSSSDRSWYILFYNCNARARCASLQFRVGLDLASGTSYARCNEWNETKRYARCMLDDEMDPYLKWDLEAVNGFTTEALGFSIDQWVIILPGFASFIRTQVTALDPGPAA